jgi:3,4-dihydroxy 2-butanone 4-phosphate synthase/GTP cyclohydrolase II
MSFATIEEIILEAQAGRIFILVDDENRENEGDLIIPAEFATPQAINFMAKYGRGLVCLSLTPEKIEELKLPMMVSSNSSRFNTAFTVSVEAKEGVTTGISAFDRAHTIATVIKDGSNLNDLAMPGHIFPIKAKPGGVLERPGHTEATIEISKLAGLNPSAVLCEIMSEDGTMARLPELLKFAEFHKLKISTIEKLIDYVKNK